jgi:hypothetical protein
VDATRRDVARTPLGAPAAPGLDAGGPYRVELAGALADVRFPPLCARCATPPAGTLAVSKMFRRVSSESPAYHVHAALPVPFCAPCLQAHEAERRPPDPKTLARLRNTFLLRLLPYVIPVFVIVFMLKEFLRPTLRELGEGDVTSALLFSIPVLFFGALLLMFWRLVRKAREGLIGPYTGDPNAQYVEFVRGHFGATYVIPGPPTSPLAAVDFTDDESGVFEGTRRTFTFANAHVGRAFEAANAALVWHPDAPPARRARWMRHALLVGLGVAVAIGLILEYFGYLGG